MAGKIHLHHERSRHLDGNDILEAMRDFGSYLDISPDDFQQIYAMAYARARERFLQGILAG